MKHFGLELEESKSRLIEFGRYAEENRRKRGHGKPETFTFLGFTHYCSRNRNGKFRVKRKTSKKKFAKKCIERLQRCERSRFQKSWKSWTRYLLVIIITTGSQIILRHCETSASESTGACFFWLNRRSQKKSYNWEEFNERLKTYPLARPRIYVNIYTW